jgi:hypothetical protein
MKHSLYDPVYVTTEHAFGEIVGYADDDLQIHLYHQPMDEVIWVPEKDVLEHLGPETGEAGDRA